MQLFHKVYSEEGEPLIILHGLFGNQGNWAAHAKRLAEHFAVYAFDARNHGRSAWSDTMSYEEMAGDVTETMKALGLEKAHFIAHSMGGKTAMLLALLSPERINKLVIVDIAPVAYPLATHSVHDALQAVNLSTVKSRAEADAVLSDYLPEQGLRDFLLTNLQNKGEEGYAWRFNLNALVEQFSSIKGGLNSEKVFDNEVLFVKGGSSDYILREHKEEILKIFPKAKIKIIDNAGHWVHSEKPNAFIKIVEDYLIQ